MSIKNFMSKAMQGLSLMGSLVQVAKDDKDLAMRVTFVAAGKFDEDLKCGIYFQQFASEPDSAEELEVPSVLFVFNRFKDECKNAITMVLNKAAELDKQQTLQELKVSHMPSAQGTVRELAAKYNKSIGEIRKLKADGLLHTLEKT